MYGHSYNTVYVAGVQVTLALLPFFCYYYLQLSDHMAIISFAKIL